MRQTTNEIMILVFLIIFINSRLDGEVYRSHKLKMDKTKETKEFICICKKWTYKSREIQIRKNSFGKYVILSSKHSHSYFQAEAFITCKRWTSQVAHFRVVFSTAVGYLFLRTFKYAEEDFNFNL
jgi:hypothetical protein